MLHIYFWNFVICSLSPGVPGPFCCLQSRWKSNPWILSRLQDCLQWRVCGQKGSHRELRRLDLKMCPGDSDSKWNATCVWEDGRASVWLLPEMHDCHCEGHRRGEWRSCFSIQTWVAWGTLHLLDQQTKLVGMITFNSYSVYWPVQKLRPMSKYSGDLKCTCIIFMTAK